MPGGKMIIKAFRNTKANDRPTIRNQNGIGLFNCNITIFKTVE